MEPPPRSHSGTLPSLSSQPASRIAVVSNHAGGPPIPHAEAAPTHTHGPGSSSSGPHTRAAQRSHQDGRAAAVQGSGPGGVAGNSCRGGGGGGGRQRTVPCKPGASPGPASACCLGLQPAHCVHQQYCLLPACAPPAALEPPPRAGAALDRRSLARPPPARAPLASPSPVPAGRPQDVPLLRGHGRRRVLCVPGQRQDEERGACGDGGGEARARPAGPRQPRQRVQSVQGQREDILQKLQGQRLCVLTCVRRVSRRFDYPTVSGRRWAP